MTTTLGSDHRDRLPPRSLVPGRVRAAYTNLSTRHGPAAFLTTTILSYVVRLFSSLVLARLLAPEAFGAVGIITTIIFSLTMISDMGFHAFIVRSSRGNETRFLDVIWTMRLIRSGLLALILLVGADALAFLFDKPELATAIRVSAPLFIIEGLTSAHMIRAEREQRAAFVALIELCSTAIQVVAAVAAALVLQSFWAIIIGIYVLFTARAILSYLLIADSGHRLARDRGVEREMWRFASVILPSNTLRIILQQSDKFVVGRMLELSALGLYMFAANLTITAVWLVNGYFTRVVLPRYAEAARDSAELLADQYYKAGRMLTLGLAVCLGGGIGGGELIIRILFDDRYLDAGVYFSLLCIAPLAMLVSRPAEQALIVIGRERTALQANAIRLAWLAVACPAAYLSHSMFAMICAFALSELPALAYWWVQLRRVGILRLRDEAIFLICAAGGIAAGYGCDITARSLVAAGFLPDF